MQLAILHYHLNRGGVTQVILNHLRSLALLGPEGPIERVVILYGGRREAWPDWPTSDMSKPEVQLAEVPELEYDDTPGNKSPALARALRTTFDRLSLPPASAIVHAHNHALGKNGSLPGALTELARDGYRLLLQVHDFAEDFRPENYRRLVMALGPAEQGNLADRMYPQGESIHYAVLNARDRQILRSAGVVERRLHPLPNPVAEFDRLPSYSDARPVVAGALNLACGDRLVVYPVRGIRRKNVGEMLLLNALDTGRTQYAVTLAPLNPAERGSFQQWSQLAIELGLRSAFDIAARGRLQYLDVLSAADTLLTTSIAEGFGMVFLESWLAGQPLVGRNLPEITADFSAAGVRFDGLYDRLLVPLDRVDGAALRHDLCETYESVCAAYGRPGTGQQQLAERIDAMLAGRNVDFAYLGSRLQQKLVTRACDSPATRHAIASVNPGLEAALRIDREVAADTISDNAQAVREHYSLEAAGERLIRVYREIANSKPDGRLEPLLRGDAILDAFLDIRRLHPIRLETCRPASESSDV